MKNIKYMGKIRKSKKYLKKIHTILILKLISLFLKIYIIFWFLFGPQADLC